MSTPFVLNCPVPLFQTDTIELAHGSGGLLTHRLIDGMFRPAFAMLDDDFTHDGALLEAGGTPLAFTTDSYVIHPLFFPGGDIGSLAVNGTVNDLAMCGAVALGLGVGLVLEEGFAIEELRRIIESMRRAADAAGVRIITGDTKVVEHGKGDGVYINTSGIGRVVAPQPITPRRVQPGDAVILSGDVGRHGIAIMAVRENLGFETEIVSDCAPLIAPVQELLAADIELHCLRDLTRGGLATSLIEIATAAGVVIELNDDAIAVSDPVRGACEILGLDPLYVANEGRFVTFVPAAAAERTLAVLRRHNDAAAIIGGVTHSAPRGEVVISTIGHRRPLDMLHGAQLPRIC